jgi:hypothetical protein
MSTVKKVLGTFLCLWGAFAHAQEKKIWTSDAYTMYNDKIVQGDYTARVLNGEHIISDYQSPTNLFKSSAISFKFSINGKDNEMVSGNDHLFVLPENELHVTTPLIEFGKQIKPTAAEKAGFLLPGATLTFRVDLRKVHQAFKDQGYYTTFNGQKIYASDFKGVYVAGGSAPMTWDFDNLMNFSHLQLKDDDGDGIYELTLELNKTTGEVSAVEEWKLSKDITAFPRLVADNTLMKAMYQLSLEEMLNAIEADSTLRTGQEWAGVWTRDVSYSIILAMAALQPEVSKISLLKKVNRNGVIVQDTGTGGAWPVSTDRMIWAVAAWEIYKVTGDKNWLEQAYTIIKKSLDVDIKNILDPVTGLVKGESSFLDWREQTYPNWMEPADIFESLSLGTNAVHYQAYHLLTEMGNTLGKNAEVKKYGTLAASIKAGINKYLWLEDNGYYAQFLYGRNTKIVSPRAETLGEALTVLFDIADDNKKKRIIENMPVTPYGASCIYPQIPNIPPYHNNGIWPFVQAYWMLASAKSKNEPAVLESIAAIYRPAALFLTNKENFVSENGDYLGTQINSSNMLWSLSGNLSIIHKVIFGIQHENQYLKFTPFIPEALGGKYSLQNYKYRNANIDIEISGYGDAVKAFTVNGKTATDLIIPATMEGKISIRIEMNNKFESKSQINRQPVLFSPAAPVAEIKTDKLIWNTVADAEKYQIIENGKTIASITGTSFSLPLKKGAVEYQVMAIGQNNIPSFASEPVIKENTALVIKKEWEDYYSTAVLPANGYSGKGYIETANDVNNELVLEVEAPKKGAYMVRIVYANGNGPFNTDNKCAIRQLSVNNVKQGIMVFPQRGKDEWSDWGWSNTITVKLKKGKNKIWLKKTPDQDNMNIDVNHALLDYIEFIQL